MEGKEGMDESIQQLRQGVQMVIDEVEAEFDGTLQDFAKTKFLKEQRVKFNQLKKRFEKLSRSS